MQNWTRTLTSSVHLTEIRKPPDVAQTHCIWDAGQNELCGALPVIPSIFLHDCPQNQNQDQDQSSRSTAWHRVCESELRGLEEVPMQEEWTVVLLADKTPPPVLQSAGSWSSVQTRFYRFYIWRTNLTSCQIKWQSDGNYKREAAANHPEEGGAKSRIWIFKSSCVQMEKYQLQSNSSQIYFINPSVPYFNLGEKHISLLIVGAWGSLIDQIHPPATHLLFLVASWQQAVKQYFFIVQKKNKQAIKTEVLLRKQQFYCNLVIRDLVTSLNSILIDLKVHHMNGNL